MAGCVGPRGSASAARDGVVGEVIVAAAVLVAGLRSVTALSQNQRYRFTTWRWGRLALVLIAVGLLLKMAVGLS